MDVFLKNLQFSMMARHTKTPRIPEGFPDERLTVLPGKIVDGLRSHPFARRLHPSRIGFFPRAAGHFIERPRGIADTILLVCLKGSGRVKSGSTGGRLEAPGCVWLRAGVPHLYKADPGSPWTLAWMHLRGSDATKFLENLAPPGRPCRLRESARVREQFERIYSLVENCTTDALRLALHTEVCNWIACLARNHEKQTADLDPRRVVLDRVLRHLGENLHRPVSLDEMASVAGWTPNHLGMVFREILRDSPASYFLHARMARACELLRQSPATIAEIADALGFEDAFYFSRCFRRCYGMSPREVRGNH